MIKKITKSGLEIFIRPESANEHETVNRIVHVAFTQDHGINTAEEIVGYLKEARKKDTFTPELSLVAMLKNGKIVGQVTLYETDIITESGRNTQLVLSQSAVLPEYRMRGILREMVDFALGRAREMGYGAVFLGGNPNLYGKFGFEPSYKYGIHHEKSEKIEGYKNGCLVCILIPGALDGVTGTTSYYAG